jgi:hypothetical protein
MVPQEEGMLVPSGRIPAKSASRAEIEEGGMWFRLLMRRGTGRVGAYAMVIVVLLLEY